MSREVNAELDSEIDLMCQISLKSLLSIPDLCCLSTDSEGSRENLHDLLCVGDLCGLILPGESDPGCSGHGL